MYKWIFLVGLLACWSAFAQTGTQRPKMTYMGAFDSGQASVTIHKLFDPTEDVVCYLLMPDQAGRKEGVNGGWIYEGNSVGAMSCVKARVHVFPTGGSAASYPKPKAKK
ncbi:hypothetical protein [Fluviibacter phosphoraccumulans]|uniref:hypothetical protein n=1 Tax=Fluviibacter phosphoraccumulans TaxID=1751046 RepID=UPI0010B83BEA|nr:hypothetical protein [Fluviibacter phosphoraccumulans]